MHKLCNYYRVVWCAYTPNYYTMDSEFEGGQADPLGGRPETGSIRLQSKKQGGSTPLTPTQIGP